MSLSRAQRRVTALLAEGAHVQYAQSCPAACPEDGNSRECVWGDCSQNPNGQLVLVHTFDPPGFPWGLYIETVQYRTLWHLHMKGLLDEDAEIAIGLA